MAKQEIEGHRKDKLKHVKLEEVIIGTRFREDLGDLEELIESIRAKGIIQPVTVDSNMVLLAGGRRCAAALELGLPTIPVIMREFESEIDSREIELMENVYRKDFTWHEQAALIHAIDELHKSKDSNWSGRKTAELLDKGVANIARNLQLAKAMQVIPELKEFKTADEALKVLKKMEEQEVTHELRQRQEQRINGGEDRIDQQFSDGQLDRGLKAALKLAQNNYTIVDCFQGMKGLKDNGNINIIECDPPYGIDLTDQKASKDSITSTVTGYKEVAGSTYADWLKRLAAELFRVAGKDSWLVFWFGPTWQREVYEALTEAGWLVDEIPAVWTKKQGQTLQPELYFARGYEPFYLARKGKPVMMQRGRLNVFDFPGVPGKLKYHPTQRPLPLITEILQTLGAGQQQVFVPFLGSGATLLACYEIGFKGFGFDLNPEYKDKFMLAVEQQTRELFQKPDDE